MNILSWDISYDQAHLKVRNDWNFDLQLSQILHY